jgi:hypothetical protein
MPSNHDILILPMSELTLGAKMNSPHCNGVDENLMPQDILDNQAEKWQISITSEAFARQLDENDSLNHLRDEFYYPKIKSLPKGVFIFDKLSLYKSSLFICS